ncbi:MAG: SDR family NAD(P)-dependent oxidoreductase, partial [Myxococcales bacterium]|nr:SDR family NAD(P)-dependent oxidoreductase [Myxococcales bacterium]
MPAAQQKVKTDRVLVVGASSGMGAALARQYAAAGSKVALLARRLDALKTLADEINRDAPEPRAHVYAHDVREYDKVPGLFRQILDDLGGLDLIVYASGTMIPGEIDEYNFAKDLEVIEVNLLGAVAWLDQAATIFDKQGTGAILAISSVAGDRGRRAYPAYHTAKAGLTTFLESLRNRMSARGVRILTVKPGFIDTPMTQGTPGLFWLISADRAAEVMRQSLQRTWLQTLYVPYRWGLVMLIIRL